MKCIICHESETEGNREYCDRCFHTTIEELDRNYGKKEGPVSAHHDVDQAHMNNPEEDAHKL